MRLRTICKSKIHQATVTETNVEYVGSIAVDEDLLRRADILPGEKVHIWNLNNGERIETYALPAYQLQEAARWLSEGFLVGPG